MKKAASGLLFLRYFSLLWFFVHYFFYKQGVVMNHAANRDAFALQPVQHRIVKRIAARPAQNVFRIVRNHAHRIVLAFRAAAEGLQYYPSGKLVGLRLFHFFIG